MKSLTTQHSFYPLLSVIAVAFSLLLPNSAQAQLMSTWTYPESSQERIDRIQILDKQLKEHDQAHEDQLAMISQAEEVLANLISQIKATSSALYHQRQPLLQAMEKYRQAQALSLSDPMVSTEPQRLTYIQVKQETSANIKTQQEKLSQLQQQIPLAKEKLTSARIKLNTLLSQLDSLYKHRDAVSDIVFVRSVKD